MKFSVSIIMISTLGSLMLLSGCNTYTNGENPMYSNSSIDQPTPTPTATPSHSPAPSPSPSNSPSSLTAWWKIGWVNGKSPYTQQNFNIGATFYNWEPNGSKDQDAYIRYMGGMDFNGGGVVQGWSATSSWDKIIGGPISSGPNQIARKTQLDFAGSAQTRFWWASKAQYPKMWLGIYLVMVPSRKANSSLTDEGFYQNWVSVIAGAHNAQYNMMGRRLRWFLETQSLYGQRRNQPEQIILRPNWEFTQDTSLGISIIRYCMSNKQMTFAQAAKFYADGMHQFVTNIRLGYNQDFAKKVRLRIAFAPAQGTKFGPMDEYLRHYTNDYDMIDLMYHPSKDRTANSKQGAYDNIYKVFTNKHTFAEVLPLARKYHLAIGSLEWSPRYEPEYYVTPGLGIYEYSIKIFHEFLTANKDIVAFTGSHHKSFVSENSLSSAPSAYSIDWQNTVRTHKQYFGRQ